MDELVKSLEWGGRRPSWAMPLKELRAFVREKGVYLSSPSRKATVTLCDFGDPTVQVYLRPQILKECEVEGRQGIYGTFPWLNRKLLTGRYVPQAHGFFAELDMAVMDEVMQLSLRPGSPFRLLDGDEAGTLRELKREDENGGALSWLAEPSDVRADAQVAEKPERSVALAGASGAASSGSGAPQRGRPLWSEALPPRSSGSTISLGARRLSVPK